MSLTIEMQEMQQLEVVLAVSKLEHENSALRAQVKIQAKELDAHEGAMKSIAALVQDNEGLQRKNGHLETHLQNLLLDRHCPAAETEAATAGSAEPRWSSNVTRHLADPWDYVPLSYLIHLAGRKRRPVSKIVGDALRRQERASLVSRTHNVHPYMRAINKKFKIDPPAEHVGGRPGFPPNTAWFGRA
tara:strand:- start:1632 stop:2195 length:564 start_codon:yes stop_codon:yes gene_type:complete